jgi:hypothetical protein
MNIDDQLISIIDRLTNAVNVCYSVQNASYEEREKNYELQYPFAAGYSRSAMNDAIDSLSDIVSQIRKGD